ncbi:MAG: SprT family zinc-dependent metalloprotease [Candidatus Onthomonas sp.]|nr:SprT family zinc-dependent metalloprotease [Candidatus Onthomonas sp.]
MTPYEVIRSRRRTVSLEIRPDLTVLVRAPLRMTGAEVDSFVRRHEGWLTKHLAQMETRRQNHPEPTAEEAQALIAKAKAVLPGKVAYYAAKMGVSPAGITITGAKTRFGSCSPKNRICFSWRLMTYPDEAIDYVVVHELAHIRHKDHSPAFHAFVASVLPDHVQRRKLLRQ